MANLISLQFQVCSKLLKLILTFGKRYINSSYAVTLYLNMGRLINAECELNELFKSSEQLLSTVNFLRLQTMCKTVWCAKVWKRKYYLQKERLLKAKKLEEQQKELMAFNLANN